MPGANPIGSAAGRGEIQGASRGSAAPTPTDSRTTATYSLFIDPRPALTDSHTYYGDTRTPGSGADYREPAPLAEAEYSGRHETACYADADAQFERHSPHTFVTAGAMTYVIPLVASSEL